MAKEKPTSAHRVSAVRDRSKTVRHVVRRDASGPVREILYPTEPSTIGFDKIDRAIERVLARKK